MKPLLFFLPVLSLFLLRAAAQESAASSIPAVSQSAEISSAAAVIEKINFSGNRTAEKLLRARLPFSEGDPLAPSALRDARTALWDMRQFKRVDVSSAALPGGGAAVEISVEDGWYLLPIPIFSGGSGGRSGGLILFSRNIFKQAESVMGSAFSGESGSSSALYLRREGWSLGAAVRRRGAAEREYADGAFSSASGFGAPSDERDPPGYGAVARSYYKDAGAAAFSAGFPLARGRGGRPALSASFGWESSKVRYSLPAPDFPRDAGRSAQARISLRTGRDEGGPAEAMGAIFGFGLADMERRLAPLPAPKFGSGSEISYFKAAPWTGSDFSYGYLLARWNGSVTWGTHRSLSLRLAGGHGAGLPPSRVLATGRETGLSGNYAREFRGASAAGAGLTYSHPFRITRRGVWQGALFAEAARAWGGPAASGTKAGAGASFWYRFWRFPLPLGFSCTWSFDDRDPQFSAAIGGRF